MAKPYLPTSDAALLAFTDNFSRIVNLTPPAFGLTAADAAAYDALRADFAAKLTAATSPDTRGRRTVFLKDETKKRLAGLTCQYAQQISKMVSVNDDQRQQLGLTMATSRKTPARCRAKRRSSASSRPTGGR